MLKFYVYCMMVMTMSMISGCTTIETRTKSQTAGNREAAVHYFMYRAAKTDADRIHVVFNPPPLKDQFDTHASSWQLQGMSSLFNFPLSAVFDSFALPFDAIMYEQSLPEKTVRQHWRAGEIEKIRVFHLKDGDPVADETVIYENASPNLMKIINELLDTLPADGTIYKKEIGTVPQYRMELFDRDGTRYIFQDYQNWLEAPSTTYGRFYDETFGRETTIRRIMENINMIHGTRELDR